MINAIPFVATPTPPPANWNNPDVWIPCKVTIISVDYTARAILYDFSQDPPAQIHWSTFAGLPDPPATMIPQVDGVVTSGPAGASCILRIIVQTPAGPKPFKWAGTDTVQVNQQGRGHVTGMTYESDAYPQNI